jgi:hypothetical protein
VSYLGLWVAVGYGADGTYRTHETHETHETHGFVFVKLLGVVWGMKRQAVLQ